MSYTIKQITSSDTHIVRHPVLRNGKPTESCFFDGDDLTTTIHLGIYSGNQLIGVCSFLKSKQPLIHQEHQYQLRGMAVLNEYQDLGLGTLILNFGENLLKQQNIETIWCNAREKAVNFYKKNSYEIIGEPFLIKNIGLHHIMYKIL